ncbi:MAG: glycosyltransferase [Solibacillus sp.]
MRILHIIPTLGSGGAEKMLIDIVREMLNQNIECEVAVLSQIDDFFGGELNSLGVPIHYGESGKVYSFRNISFLKKLIKNKEYDYIHAHLFGAQLFTPIALKWAHKRIPLITTEHSTHNKRRDKKIFYFLDALMYKQYRGIICITAATKENLSSYMPSVKNKMILIENGIDISQYENAIALKTNQISTELAANEKIILMVAAMREQKDHATLIRASKLLPSDCRVVFVGDGERMEEIKEYALEYGADSILFLGTRKDVPSLMKSSDVFVLSSHWEGFGLVVVEAAAAGLPVIASNVSGLSDVVNTIGGQLFEPYKEEDLANKIIEALGKNKEYKNLDNYKIQTTVNEYLKFYSEVSDKWRK